MQPTLEEILESREKRAELQRELIGKFSSPVVCFTMNIAGPVKVTNEIIRAFSFGVERLSDALKKYTVHFFSADYRKTGCQAIYAVDADAKELKDISVSIEESCPLGRLFDIDVIGTDGKKLERKSERGCLVCHAVGRACAASRAHSTEELWRITNEIIDGHFAELDGNEVASMAHAALLREVNTTPKPGLVDRRNNGSHADMDISTFIASADAIRPYFYECFTLGKKTRAIRSGEAFPLLREAGIRAEKQMYAATGGVNTHKGIIYSMGILCAAIGRLHETARPYREIPEIQAECIALCKSEAENDLSRANGKTAGEKLYIEKRITGVRGEAASGFSSAVGIGLASYERAILHGLSENDAGAYALLRLIAEVTDTTLYKRGGDDGARYASDRAKALTDKELFPTVAQIEAMDDELIRRNLSAGGCADLLAIAYFMHEIKKKAKKELG